MSNVMSHLVTFPRHFATTLKPLTGLNIRNPTALTAGRTRHLTKYHKNPQKNIQTHRTGARQVPIAPSRSGAHHHLPDCYPPPLQAHYARKYTLCHKTTTLTLKPPPNSY